MSNLICLGAASSRVIGLGAASSRTIELFGSTSHDRNCGVNQVEALKALEQKAFFGVENVVELTLDPEPEEPTEFTSLDEWTVTGFVSLSFDDEPFLEVGFVFVDGVWVSGVVSELEELDYCLSIYRTDVVDLLATVVLSPRPMVRVG